MRAFDPRGWRTGFAALALACAFTLPATAQSDNEATKKEIQTALDECTRCMTSKDLDGYGKHLTDDYRRIDFLGETSDRQKTLSYLRSLTDPADDISSTAAIESMRIKGNDATVLVRVKGKATTKGPDEKSVPISWDQREVQVWTKTANGWRLRDSMGLTESIQVDGKPFSYQLSDEAAAARTSIQSVYNALTRAAVEGNTQAVSGVIPAAFVIYPPEGGAARSRDLFLSQIRDHIAAKGGTADYKLERAHVNGDRAVVLGAIRVESTETINGEPTKTTTTTWHRDVWEKTDAGWKPVEFRPLLREKSVGGKIGSAIYASPASRG